MARVYLSLGSNMGDRLAHLAFGVRSLEASVGLVCHRSSVYRTAPHGVPPQDDFYNLVLECETALPPEQVLLCAQAVEVDCGRVRGAAKEPRTLDIDILLYGDLRVHTTDLEVPHPRMERRAFVLVPLAEIAPGLLLPSGKTPRDLLEGPEIATQRVEKVNDAEL